jgi:FtsH-binding integral membrane protein
MSDSVRPTPMGHADMSLDAGLRKHMLGVYNKLALGMLVSAASAYLTSSYPPVRDLMFQTVDGQFKGLTGLGMYVSFAALPVMLFVVFSIQRLHEKTVGIAYWTVVSLMGASLGVLILRFTGASVVSTFLITATSYGVLKLVGYTNKKALRAFGSFLILGLVGLFLTFVVYLFTPDTDATNLAFFINIFAALTFAGLLAVGTYLERVRYYETGGDQKAMGVMSYFGALTIYTNFIKMFWYLLSIARR